MISALALQSHAQLENLSNGTKSTEKADKNPTLTISDQLEIWKKQVEDDLSRLSKFTDETTLPAKVG
ncbi:MAG: hypothetical protein ACK46A_04695, partial [Akkermansiaceae bacterium]